MENKELELELEPLFIYLFIKTIHNTIQSTLFLHLKHNLHRIVINGIQG